MDLKNQDITIGELLGNPKARQIAEREFPKVVRNQFAMALAQNMTLRQALRYGDAIPQERLQRILKELEAI